MKIDGAARFLAALKSNSYKREKGLWIEAASKRAARRWKAHYNDSAQKTPAVRKNVRGMNAPITNNATIILTGFSSGIVGNSTSLVSK